MKLTAEVLAVLTDRAQIDGDRLVLTGPRMDPKLYQQVNEVLEAVGGRWTTTAGAHLFPTDAAAALAPVITSGQVVTLREKRNSAQYFPTPASVVQRLLELADLKPGMTVLEPSAGSGAIAATAATTGAIVDCYEQDPGYAGVLTDTGAARAVTVADFLTVDPSPDYDRVVMNPPFTKQADIAHVQHALRFLKPDGHLVAVMSHAVTYGKGDAANFRNLVEARGGQVEALPNGAFAESGTDVRTILVTIPATRPALVQPLVWPTDQPAPAPDTFQYEDPAVIAREIADNLRDAMKVMDDLARDLARPKVLTKKAETVVNLPEPVGQLSFEQLGEAS
jgi:predicted RNA methylase